MRFWRPGLLDANRRETVSDQATQILSEIGSQVSDLTRKRLEALAQLGTYAATGKAMGVSRERIAQILRRAERMYRVAIGRRWRREAAEVALKTKERTAVAAEEAEEKVGEGILIEDLGLSMRSYCCLKRAGINTSGELLQKTEKEIFKLHNMGKKSLKEVKNRLAEMGLVLRPEEEASV